MSDTIKSCGSIRIYGPVCVIAIQSCLREISYCYVKRCLFHAALRWRIYSLWYARNDSWCVLHHWPTVPRFDLTALLPQTTQQPLARCLFCHSRCLLIAHLNHVVQENLWIAWINCFAFILRYCNHRRLRRRAICGRRIERGALAVAVRGPYTITQHRRNAEPMFATHQHLWRNVSLAGYCMTRMRHFSPFVY